MADIYDDAQATDQFFLEKSLQFVKRTTPTIEAVGECLYCQEPLPRGVRWCVPPAGAPREQSCVALWEKEKARGIGPVKSGSIYDAPVDLATEDPAPPP